MIKAIIFDISGVLMDLYPDRCRKSFREDCGFDRIDEYLDPCHQKGPINDLESGMITVEQFFDKVREQSRFPASDEQIAKSFCSLLEGIQPEKVELIGKLKEKYDLFLLSNNNSITMRYTAEVFAKAGIPFETTFKGVYVSAEMKLIKPGRAIFEETVRRTGYKPGEILFIDDSISNITGAREVGMNALFYQVGTSLTGTVERYLADNAS